MWASFWKNCAGQVARGLSVHQQCKLLNRCVRPVLYFRNTRWPWTLSLAESQSKVQRKMLLQFIRIERKPEEPLETFHRRRLKTAAELAKQHEDWGIAHEKCICAWVDHLQRPLNSTSPAAQLFSWRPASWLQSRRDDPRTGGHARPGTRACSGPVPARWDESHIKAKAHLQKLQMENSG